MGHWHGFSVSAWRWILDGPSEPSAQHPPETGLGKPQKVRSDDWSVVLPINLAQRHTGFTSVQPLMGWGQNLWVVPTAVVAHPLTVFRPHTWGYFFGADVGMAWQWQVYFWSLLLGFAWLVRVAWRLDWAACGTLGLIVVESPFFQLWGLNSALLSGSAAAGLAAWLNFSQSAPESRVGRRSEVARGIFLGSLGVVFALTLYPPFQIPWVVLGTCVVVCRRAWLPRRVFASAIAVMLGAGVLFWSEAHEAFRAMAATVYPGQRLSHGGDLAWMDLFRGNVLPILAMRNVQENFGNPCEAASVLWISPWLALALALAWVLSPRRSAGVTQVFGIQDSTFAGICVSAGLTGAFFYVGIPRFFPEALLAWVPWARVPTYRGTSFWQAVDLLLSAHLILRLRDFPRPSFKQAAKRGKMLAGLALALALLLETALVVAWQHRIPSLLESPRSQAWVALLILGQWGLCALAYRRNLRAVLGLWLALHVAMSWSFNPLQRGGVDPLLEHPLAKALKAHTTDHEAWVVFGSPSIQNFLPMIGVRNLTALQYTPHRELWKILDREGRFDGATRRYAHLLMTHGETEIQITSPQPDAVTVEIHPDHPLFLKLPAQRILATEEEARHWVGNDGTVLLKHWEHKATVQNTPSSQAWHIFERVRR